MMVKKGWLQVRCGDEQLKSLDKLEDSTGMYRSEVLRELIPPAAVIEAMGEQAALQGRDKRNVARDIALSCVTQLAEQMVNDPNHPIGLQYEVLCGGMDPLIKTALLYTRWARAKLGTENYRFEQIVYQGKARFTIVIGPGDTDAAIDALKKQIVEYAEKLRL